MFFAPFDFIFSFMNHSNKIFSSLIVTHLYGWVGKHQNSWINEKEFWVRIPLGHTGRLCTIYFFSLISLITAAVYVRAESKFCNRDGWRENYVDDYRLAYKALTGSPDWVNQSKIFFKCVVAIIVGVDFFTPN